MSSALSADITSTLIPGATDGELRLGMLTNCEGRRTLALPERAAVLSAIVTSATAALVVVCVVAIAKSRWLYLVVPKLYFETPLSKGHVVTMTLANGGFRTEEDVHVTLKKTCTYELLASSKSGTSLAQGVLRIPRISRFEKVTALILAEGKTFEHSDIESVESKDTTGKVVEKPEQVSNLRDQAMMWPILALLLGGPFIVGTLVGKYEGMWAWDYVVKATESFTPSKQLAGFRTEVGGVQGGARATKLIKSGEVTHRIKEIVRRGDILEFRVVFMNRSAGFVLMSVDSKGPASAKGPLGYDDRRIADLFVGPGLEAEGTLKAFMPESWKPQTVVLDFRAHTADDMAWYTSTLNFE